MIRTLFAAACATTAFGLPLSHHAAAPNAGEKVLSQFATKGPTEVAWRAENDPVMGGKSVSTAVVERGELAWKGEVKIVPFLHAPGFCTVRTEAFKGDVSAYAKGGMFYDIAKHGGNLTKFQVQFSSAVRSNPEKGEFQCDVALPATESPMAHYYVPFASCKETFRGKPEGGPPTAAQLAKITQIGLGSDGVKGDFDLSIKTVGVYMSAPAPGPPSHDVLPLITFEAGKPTTYKWTDLNDPVMGGTSTSTFTVDERRGVGVFDGDCRIVPKLKAPGFCNAEARPGTFSKKIPDASKMIKGGLVYVIRNTGTRPCPAGPACPPLTKFKAAFGGKTEHDFGSFKSDITVPADGKTHEIFAPFDKFSNKWSSYTGEPTTPCSREHPEVCPTAKSLAEIGSIGIWAEGVAGKFTLEIREIGASAGRGPSPSPAVCKKTEFCCPDAKHCLTATERSCARSGKCEGGLTCCPLTKLCVKVGAACTPPPACSGKEYCCPDVLKCLTPTNPGFTCSKERPCKKDQVHTDPCSCCSLK